MAELHFCTKNPSVTSPRIPFSSSLKMGSKVNYFDPPILCKFPTRKLIFRTTTIAFSTYAQNKREPIPSPTTTAAIETQKAKTGSCSVSFKTLRACKLGISRYPDFEYNAEGGAGTGIGTTITSGHSDKEISVCFDIETVHIPPLTSTTTKFLGLPLPPLLKIDIVPELFNGSINQESGKVVLEFTANFWFSVGSIYRAPPLLVKTVLTSEESKGKIRSGRGERLNKEGKCKLVGVATVDPIDDFLMNSFLGLPTECLANLNAVISFSNSS